MTSGGGVGGQLGFGGLEFGGLGFGGLGWAGLGWAGLGWGGVGWAGRGTTDRLAEKQMNTRPKSECSDDRCECTDEPLPFPLN